MIQTRVATCLCLLTMVAATKAQTPEPSAVEKRLEVVARSYTPDDAFMGAVLVVDGDRVLLDKGYGMADLEWKIPNAPDVRFRLGSLTKQFTATLVLLLQQDGKLKISDPVSKYLPKTPKAWAGITLENLLGHTSGIPNFTSDKDFDAWRMAAHTTAEELAFFRDKPLDFAPGSKFDYSNSNYEVLGAVIEAVSGQKYSDLLQQRIFTPVGMKNTGLDTDELILPRRAQGYIPGKAGLEHARSESMTVPWAAGSLYSTTGDLLLWEHALFGGKVLNEASLQAMTTPGKGDYGLGLFIDNQEGVRVIGHGGGIEGFNTNLSEVPVRGLVVVVLSNVNGAAPGRMSRQLRDVVLGKPVVLASERRAVPITKQELARFSGVYDVSPTASFTVAASGDGLSLQATDEAALPLMYQGDIGGHPRFFLKGVDAEVEFIPNTKGVITSLILQGEAAKKR